MSRVILMVGAPFSGCSLLAQMLGSHPHCAAAPELKLGLADTVDALLELAEVSQVPLLDGLLRFVAEHVTGGQHRDGIKAAFAWLGERRTQSTAELLASLQAAVAPRHLVIPDGESALRPNELLRWQRLAPELAVIHCLRHPLMHGAVWAPWLKAQLYVPPDFRDHSVSPASALIEPQLPWLRCAGNLERWVPEAKRIRLRMEDLDVAAEDTLGDLCRSLDLPCDPNILSSMWDSTASPFAGWGPPEAPGGLEMDALAAVTEQALPIALPPQLDAPAPWHEDGRPLDPGVVALARQYGYV